MEGKYGVTCVLKDYEQSVVTLLKQVPRLNCSVLQSTVMGTEPDLEQQ
jgi:hypothetical protein